MADASGRKAAELVAQLIDRIGAKDTEGVVPLVTHWRAIVGDAFADHSRILDIRHQALVVGVDHPGWLQQIHLDQQRILSTIRQRVPETRVTALHLLVVDDLPGAAAVLERVKEQLPPVEQLRREVPPVTLDQPGPAAEDEEFLSHLRGLKAALERKSPD